MCGLGALQDLTPWSPGSQSAVLICASSRDPLPSFRGSLSFSPGHRAVLGSRCAGGSRSLGINLLWKFADVLEGTWDSGQWAWGPWNNSTLHLQDGYFCYIHILSLSLEILFYYYLHSGTLCDMWDLISPAKDQTWPPAAEAPSLTCWTAKEAPPYDFLSQHFLSPASVSPLLSDLLLTSSFPSPDRMVSHISVSQ